MATPTKSLAHGLRWARRTAALLRRRSDIGVMAGIIETQMILSIKGGQLKSYPYPKPFFSQAVANAVVGLYENDRILELMEMLDTLWDERDKHGSDMIPKEWVRND